MTTYPINILRPNGETPFQLSLETGRTLVIVGANGSGKTRLGLRIEQEIPNKVHRIPAHKSLALNDRIQLLSLERAKNAHLYGYADIEHESQLNNSRWGNRWGGRPAVHLLSDYDALLQRLFAAHNNAAVTFLREHKTAPSTKAPTTQFDRLKTIWEGLLPHRKLVLQEASVEIYPVQPSPSSPYHGSKMSDGERAIFYYLGQCLLAPEDADGRSSDDIAHLLSQNVYVLPVAEIENVLLLPDVFLSLARTLACETPERRLTELTLRVVEEVRRNIGEVCARYTIRQIDARLKRLSLSAKDLPTLQRGYESEISTVNPQAVFDDHRRRLEEAVNNSDLSSLLRLYDNKGLLALAASCLGVKGPKELKEKVTVLLASDAGKRLGLEIKKVLPAISSQ